MTGTTRTASATVTINASKSVPNAHDDHFTLDATTLQLRAPGLMANDTGGIGRQSSSAAGCQAVG